MTREQLIVQFLQNNGWGDAKRTPFPGDASSRSYERLTRSHEEIGEEQLVLMNAPFMPHKDPYSTAAKLAGSDPDAFICLATALTRRGFSAPRIFATDRDNGFMLLEDLGADLFSQVLTDDPGKEQELYSCAIDCLAAIYRSSFSDQLSARGAQWLVRKYDAQALQTEADLFLEWYVPEFGSAVDETAKAAWYEIWADAFTHLNAHAHGIALRDFHADNVFWLPEREAIAKIGLIDFQDALIAHPSYDLVSLLEDARRDVDIDMVGGLISRFCQQAGIPDDEKFSAAYAVQAAQRNAKILGIFVRLARRDGKQRYLDMIPRVAQHFSRDISHPALANMHDWVSEFAPNVLETTA
ncbi:MAG: phosphotransferase [Robiginitomaculum sp.]|nr:phosphotransferase [Robiginitomaculum sp.]